MTTAIIEPTTIEEAEEQAKRLMALAYAPHSVAQADGSTLSLCYAGRIHRAYQMRQVAIEAGDTGKAQTYAAAIEKLIDMAQHAYKIAEDADVLYQGMCAVKGVEAHNTTPPDCECVGCLEKNKGWRMSHAMEGVRKAAWTFLGDDGEGQPPIINLFRKARSDEKARDMIWRHLLSITDSMQCYMDECGKVGERPNWKELFS